MTSSDVRDPEVHHRFVLEADGEAWAALTLAAPGTSWADGAATVVTVDVDGERRQDVVLAAGADPTEYVRCLGRLIAGPHLLRVWNGRAQSGPSTRPFEVAALHTGSVADGDPAARVWASAPILHYRDDNGPDGGAATDTPLLLFYRPARPGDGPGTASEGLEYHVVFSHEDGGTDLTGLLAKWGHTVDIEWVYRVFWDGAGAVAAEEFQGPGHRSTPFRGARDWGAHPVLQVIGRHGMVTDRVEGRGRTALAPLLPQPPGEPREGVLQRFPWIARVSALEVCRQVTLEATPAPASPAPADLRAYLFLQWTLRPQERGAFEAAVRVGADWYTSAWGRADLALEGTDAESTAVKLPAGVSDEAVTAIAVRAIDTPTQPVELRLVRAFRLDDDFRPRPPLAANGKATVTGRETWVTAWERPAAHEPTARP